MWTLFFALTAVHIYTNWRAMKTLALRSLNLERSQLLIKGFLSHLPRDAFDSCHLHRNSTEIEAVFQNSGDLSLSHVGRNEPIMKPFLPSYLRPKESVILNSDIATVLSNVDIDILKNSIHHYREEEFIICSSRDSQTIHILMKVLILISSDCSIHYIHVFTRTYSAYILAYLWHIPSDYWDNFGNLNNLAQLITAFCINSL